MQQIELNPTTMPVVHTIYTDPRSGLHIIHTSPPSLYFPGPLPCRPLDHLDHDPAK